jgi:hypothetical protein
LTVALPESAAVNLMKSLRALWETIPLTKVALLTEDMMSVAAAMVLLWSTMRGVLAAMMATSSCFWLALRQQHRVQEVGEGVS